MFDRIIRAHDRVPRFERRRAGHLDAWTRGAGRVAREIGSILFIRCEVDDRPCGTIEGIMSPSSRPVSGVVAEVDSFIMGESEPIARIAPIRSRYEIRHHPGLAFAGSYAQSSLPWTPSSLVKYSTPIETISLNPSAGPRSWDRRIRHVLPLAGSCAQRLRSAVSK